VQPFKGAQVEKSGALFSGFVFDFFIRVAQNISSSPDRFDIIDAVSSLGEFFSQFTYEDVDNFQFRLVHSPIEVVQEHFFCQGRALAKGKQFQNAIFLASQMD